MSVSEGFRIFVEEQDDGSRPRFEQRGMGPFRPGGEGGEAMQYYEVPADLREDADALAPRVAEAVEVARRARTRRRPRRRQ